MNKKHAYLSIFASGLLTILLFSCNKESRWDCVKRTGETATEVRALPPFTQIYIEDNADVFITQGNTHEVKIEAGNNLISLIKTEVDSGKLHIKNNNHCNWARSYKKGTINVYVTLPTLTNIWHYGSGLVKSTDTINCDVLEIWTHQSGDADLIVNANKIFTNMHTTGDITLRGRSGQLGIWHGGEGYLHCEDLLTDYAWATAKTSGNEFLNVTTSLNVTINWEGNIYYSGNPITGRDGPGKGQLIKQN